MRIVKGDSGLFHISRFIDASFGKPVPDYILDMADYCRKTRKPRQYVTSNFEKYIWKVY